MRTNTKSIRRWLAGCLLLGVCLLAGGYRYRHPIRRAVEPIREAYELAFLPQAAKQPRTIPNPPVYIAHGGGMISGLAKTNSRDALDETYTRGFRYFEIDFNWTADGHLVAIHDWNQSKVKIFGGQPGRMTREQFVSSQADQGLSQLTLDDLVDWLKHDGDKAYIVTDIREDNFRAAIPFVPQFMIFAAPVFRPASAIEGDLWRAVYGLIPIAGPIEFFRWCLLDTPAHPVLWAVGALSTTLCLLGGLAYFRRMEDSFADVV